MDHLQTLTSTFKTLSNPAAACSLRPLIHSGDRTAAAAIAALDLSGDYTALSEDEDLVLSLASSPIVSVRLRMARVLKKRVDLVRPELMVRVLLGVSADLYPVVREVAMGGLVELLKKGGEWIGEVILKECFDRGVECLRDEDETVRSAAVRLVSECGRLFAESGAGKASNGVMDVIFIKLCWMARDMSLNVRTEAFTALGNVRLVSEAVMTQSLTKKLLKEKNGVGSLYESIVKNSECPPSSAAGTFVHGIEDEFHEVRTASCKSLGTLSIFSVQFADDALNLLMDMLNDDVTAVRLQTLQTLFHMAAHDQLTVQDKHVHMFLGSLADTSAEIRHAARKVLRLMKLPKSEMFISTIDALVTNLVTHPEEEEDIFYVLFFIGKTHGKFAAKRVKKFEQEILPSREVELNLDSPQAAALLVLAISSSLSEKERKCDDVPGTLFSYSVPLFGPISRALRDVLQEDFLLAYLIRHSGMPFPTRMPKSKEFELLPSVVSRSENILDNTAHFGQVCSYLPPIHSEMSEFSSRENLFDLIEASTSLEQSRKNTSCLDKEITQCVNLIFKSVSATWLLIQSRRTCKAQRILRACKEELEMIAWDSDGSIAGLLAFASYYVQLIQLFAQIWEQLQPKPVVGMTALDLLLERLDIDIKRMRYNFTGLCREEQYHILELMLLGYILKMCKVGICSSLQLSQIQAVISRVEHLSEEGTLKFSDFYIEMKKSFIEQSTREAPKPFPVSKLLKIFCLEPILFSKGLKHIKAKLSATGNDSENPVPFVPGLPVGIAFQITLYNISNKGVLWIRMSLGESVQYVFLNISQFEGSGEVRKCMVTLPFYGTPRASSFLLRACVCMECPLEGAVYCKKDRGGPRHDLTLLSEECDVYFIQIEKR